MDKVTAQTPEVKSSGDTFSQLMEMLSKIAAAQEQINTATSSGGPGSVNVMPPNIIPMLQMAMQQKVSEIIQQQNLGGTMQSLYGRGPQGQMAPMTWMPPNIVAQVQAKQQQAMQAVKERAAADPSKGLNPEKFQNVPYWMINQAMSGSFQNNGRANPLTHDAVQRLNKKAPEGGYTGEEAKRIWGSD
jgi:hypothetical protein